MTLDALPGVTLTGKVAAIDPAGQAVQDVVSFNVRIDLNPTTAPIKLDMATNARLLGESHANVLAVPFSAIRSATDGSKYVVVVDGQGAQGNVTVTPGMTQGKLTEVAGDLQEGEQILIGPAMAPTDLRAFEQ